MQHDFILLDRSGSMSSLWDEAIGSINTYAQKLADDSVDTGITIATFDKATQSGQDPFLFEVVRDRITPKTLKPLSVKEITPRGFTPLSDAIGKVVTLAEAGGYEKVAIIIMTDGHENASKEYTVAQAKARLDQCRAKNWQVIFLGADFDNVSQATSFGNAAGQTIRASAANLRNTMAATATMRGTYGLTGQSINYSDEIKNKMAETK